MLEQFGIIYIISAGYLVFSLILMLTRKHKLKGLTMVPPLCQVASILALDANLFPESLTANLPVPLLVLLFLVNLLILFLVSIIDKKQMTPAFAQGSTPRAKKTKEPSRRGKKGDKGADNANYSSVQVSAPRETVKPMPVAPINLPNLEETSESVLTRPEAANEPVNTVLPVEQEIFSASQGEVEAIIDKMVASGDMDNAKRYLRMLAFFAKDEPSRKLAETKLAEINAKAN